MKAKKQLDDKEDVENPLEKIIKKAIRKLRNRGAISHEILRSQIRKVLFTS